VHLGVLQFGAGKRPDESSGPADRAMAEAPSTIFNDALRPYGLEIQSRSLPVKSSSPTTLSSSSRQTDRIHRG
jgi:hypothetical protein